VRSRRYLAVRGRPLQRHRRRAERGGRQRSGSAPLIRSITAIPPIEGVADMTQAATRLDVIPQSGHAGAEIRGVDLTRELAEDEIATIRDALLKWKVEFFRDQFLDHDQHLRFSSYFGKPTPAHPLFDSIPDPDYPTIYPIFRDRFKARIANSSGYDKVRWHADVTAAVNPPFASILRAETLPPYGGDTQWSNAVAAYN